MGPASPQPQLLSIPNFSEGRNAKTVAALVAAANSAGATVMDASSDPDHNRSVIAMFGSADALVEAVGAMAEVAIDLIDLRKHHGEHPRFGSMDVVPFVPLAGSDMRLASGAAGRAGEVLAHRLDLPVFFYSECATSPERQDLAAVRRACQNCVGSELYGDACPDIGPHSFHPRAGAVTVGARGPLVAYNVNLPCADLDIAVRIARRIRQMRDTGEGMAGVKAIGLELRSIGCVQVSTNVTMPDTCRPREVFELVTRLARDMGVDAASSELIGVASRKHITEAHEQELHFGAMRDSQWLETWGLHYHAEGAC